MKLDEIVSTLRLEALKAGYIYIHREVYTSSE